MTRVRCTQDHSEAIGTGALFFTAGKAYALDDDLAARLIKQFPQRFERVAKDTAALDGLVEQSAVPRVPPEKAIAAAPSDKSMTSKARERK